jgi:hypothetical protein
MKVKISIVKEKGSESYPFSSVAVSMEALIHSIENSPPALAQSVLL